MMLPTLSMFRDGVTAILHPGWGQAMDDVHHPL